LQDAEAIAGSGYRFRRGCVPADHRRKVAALSRMEFLQSTAEDLADL
jgi:hypothetical protein